MTTGKQIAIIGAGPAGLMAAECLAIRGYAVTLYDRMPTPARKFLIAGRGGLNLTHSEPLEVFIPRYGAASEWMAPYIIAFPPSALCHWCEGLGEEVYVGSSGRIFPRRMKAVPLLRAWLQRLQALGVQYAPRHNWRGWDGDALCFTGPEGQVMHVTPHATLLALGGASWPRLGSDGAWVEILRQHGVEMAPLCPANVGFLVKWSDYFIKHFAGHPLKPLALSHHKQTRQGEAMMTAQGIEGNVIYALGTSIRDAISAQGHTDILLDLRPQMTQAALTQKLAVPRGNKSFSTYLRGAGFSPLAVALLREIMPSQWLAAATPEALAAIIKALPLRLTGIAGMEYAISSAGGIRQNAVHADLMLRARPGVFVAGEMLDWEAPTGGYLLQACFSTAVAAAEAMHHYVETKPDAI
ncbi:MAG: TIGR03862 family flavoprotein [Rickettsiales bacterium]|nr:TIGR03862 family flavoprotein [Rickettsiales bacterium]